MLSVWQIPVGSTDGNAIQKMGIQQLFAPDHGLDTLAPEMIRNAGNVISKDLRGGFLTAFGTEPDGIVFIVSDIDDPGLEKSDHFVKEIKNEFVIIFIGGAAGIRIRIIGPFCQFGMSCEQIIAVGESRHLGNDFHTAFPAVVDQLFHLFLCQNFTPAVCGVNGVFFEIELVADFIGFTRIFIHELRIFQPAFIDLRV